MADAARARPRAWCADPPSGLAIPQHGTPVGKGLAVALAAKAQGVQRHEAYSLGALMNARGLMELILLNIGLQTGLLGEKLYTILALMAIVTTFAATPLQRWFAALGRRAGADQELPGNEPVEEEVAPIEGLTVK
jgi:hypothetical protein